MDGGIASAKQGHDVIMTPTSHCYFDYYQADPEFQPVAIGGYTTLKKVYSFEPVPPGLNQQQAENILGAQGNVWTEYIKTPAHAEYMSVPRMSALAEVCWTAKEKRDWERFIQSMQLHYKRLDHLDVNYCPGSYKVNIEIFRKEDDDVYARLSSEIWDADIYYTINGNMPDIDSDIYKNPVLLDSASVIKAVIFQNNNMIICNLQAGTTSKMVHFFQLIQPARRSGVIMSVH